MVKINDTSKQIIMKAKVTFKNEELYLPVYFFHHYTQGLQNINASGVQTNLKSLKSPWVLKIFFPHFSLFFKNHTFHFT